MPDQDAPVPYHGAWQASEDDSSSGVPVPCVKDPHGVLTPSPGGMNQRMKDFSLFLKHTKKKRFQNCQGLSRRGCWEPAGAAQHSLGGVGQREAAETATQMLQKKRKMEPGEGKEGPGEEGEGGRRERRRPCCSLAGI